LIRPHNNEINKEEDSKGLRVETGSVRGVIRRERGKRQRGDSRRQRQERQSGRERRREAE
jgi:hypothetical protein